MRLLDSHCHLQSHAFDEDREAVLNNALAALEGIVVIGDTLESSQQGVAMSSSNIRAAIGVHPHNAKDFSPGTIDTLTTLSQTPGVAAIGEIGLDYFYDFSPREMQHEALIGQLELAARLTRPVVIHCRDAYDDIIPILDDWHTRIPGGVMHCFSGDEDFARRCIAWGFFISFAGNVTFPKAQPLRDAAKVVPLNRLLVETDSPYLAPQPVRGKRCEPPFVEHTARRLAEVLEVPFELVVERTTENARNLFGFSG